jgi:hypothetical protein
LKTLSIAPLRCDRKRAPTDQRDDINAALSLPGSAG